MEIPRPDRIRKINGGFAFIEHRFLRSGFFEALTSNERTLYLFLLLVADRNGTSFYDYERICKFTGLLLDDYVKARNCLIDKDLIAFDGRVFQVLSLPSKPVKCKPTPSGVATGAQDVAVQFHDINQLLQKIGRKIL